ncbi:unnamed protein product [Pedinophyceae sp. YPF-701]|nr:unnamed protein product [Pedinophyceae sp. YPF-701]
MGRVKTGPGHRKLPCPLYAGSWVTDDLFVVAGGGGKTKSGIPNRIMLLRVDNGAVTEPVAFVDTPDAPLALAVHPAGRMLLAAMASGGCIAVSIDIATATLRVNEAVTDKLSADRVGSVSRIVYDKKGMVVAFGLDGPVTSRGSVVSVVVLDASTLDFVSEVEAAVHGDTRAGVKDVDFCRFGQPWLAVVDESGSVRVANYESGVVFSQMPAPPPPFDKAGAARCQFSRQHDESALFVLSNCAVRGEPAGYVARWELIPQSVADSVGRVNLAWIGGRFRQAIADPITTMNISRSGSRLVVGSSEGEIRVLAANAAASTSYRLKDAHMVVVTQGCFSPDENSLLTVSADSSVRVTNVAGVKGASPGQGGGSSGGSCLWTLVKLVLFLCLLAAVVVAYLVDVAHPGVIGHETAT